MPTKMSQRKSSKEIRVGVVGGRRGMSFARSAGGAGMKLVAICDSWPKALKEAQSAYPDVATYSTYEKFLEHDMDAVVLANYFHQHAPLAVQAMKAGKHVMSETTACKTLAEAVALVRAVEKYKKIYMMAENYCFFAYNQEMRRLYQADEIGEVMFAECEYMHPFRCEEYLKLSPGFNHWRHWCPRTYYSTHALGPIMYITDTRPVSVNAQSIPFSKKDTEYPVLRKGDAGFTIVCRMDNRAVVNVQGLVLRGHGNWYRLHGSRGLMENLRTQGAQQKLRVVHEEWDLRPGDVREKIYTPEFPVHADRARKTGHGGGDFFTNFFFSEAIRTGRQPWLNVYRALDMSIVGIQSWRSCIANGAPFEIPDFRKESARRKYAGDHWSPYPEDAGRGQPLPSIEGLKKETPADRRKALAVWKKMGWVDA